MQLLEEDTSAAGFLEAFNLFAAAVRRARGAQVQHGERDLTLSQYGLLQPLLNGQPSARVSDLAGEAGISAPTATRILDALERRGLVERRRSAEDRRGVSVTLTRQGRELLATQHEWMRARERVFYERLPAVERDLAPDLLERLAGLIDELAAGPE